MPLRWRRLLEFYDHHETQIRAAVQVVLADVVDSHRAQQELVELLSWVRDRWWLRLSPEDVDAHNESFMDLQAFLELPCPVRRRMHAERALICLEEHFGSQLVKYERNMVRARHDEEQSTGLWRTEMANAHAHAAAEQEAAVARYRFLAAAALDNTRADLRKASSVNAIAQQSLSLFLWIGEPSCAKKLIASRFQSKS